MNKTETIKKILNLTQLQNMAIKEALPDLSAEELEKFIEIRERNKVNLEYFDSIIEK
jgi:DNA-binding sugar fermentation-stimulating protein